jgi:hypothetical protein
VSHRLFKAFEEATIEGYHPKQDPVVEAAILAKYGGLFLADPDIDGKAMVLKINQTQLLCTSRTREDPTIHIVCMVWDQIKQQWTKTPNYLL